jgi:hypothetical protein
LGLDEFGQGTPRSNPPFLTDSLESRAGRGDKLFHTKEMGADRAFVVVILDNGQGCFEGQIGNERQFHKLVERLALILKVDIGQMLSGRVRNEIVAEIRGSLLRRGLDEDGSVDGMTG